MSPSFSRPSIVSVFIISPVTWALYCTSTPSEIFLYPYTTSMSFLITFPFALSGVNVNLYPSIVWTSVVYASPSLYCFVVAAIISAPVFSSIYFTVTFDNFLYSYITVVFPSVISPSALSGVNNN